MQVRETIASSCGAHRCNTASPPAAGVSGQTWPDGRAPDQAGGSARRAPHHVLDAPRQVRHFRGAARRAQQRVARTLCAPQRHSRVLTRSTPCSCSRVLLADHLFHSIISKQRVLHGWVTVRVTTSGKFRRSQCNLACSTAVPHHRVRRWKSESHESDSNSCDSDFHRPCMSQTVTRTSAWCRGGY